jgi:dienelactone hydrolase
LVLVWCAWAAAPGCGGQTGRSDLGGEELAIGDGDPGTEDAGFPDGQADTSDATDGDAGDSAADGDYLDAGGDPGTTLDPGLPGGPAGAIISATPELTGCLPTSQGQGEAVPLAIYLPVGPGPFPVIIFHHGFQLGVELYASYGQHLATWGYLAILPQMPGVLIGGPNHRELKECLIALIDWVQQNATDPAGPLAGKADQSRLGLAGHSMGGKSSLLAATEDARPRAVFGIDPVDAAGGPIPGSPEDYPSVTPELMDRITVPLGLLGETTNATCTGFMCQACAPAEDNFQQYYQYAVSPALEIEVLGANHMSFLDDPNCGYVCSACPAGTDDPAQTRLLTRRTMTAFFNVFLRQQQAYDSYLTGAGMAAYVAAGLVTSQSKNGF